MRDLFDGGVDDESATNENDDAVYVKGPVYEAVVGESEERILEKVDDLDQDEKQDDAQDDGQADANPSHSLLLIDRCSARFQRYVEQVVDAENGLQDDERGEG